MKRRVGWLLAVTLMSCWTASAAITNVVISPDVGNGGFQIQDPFEAFQGTNVLTVISNATGRRLIDNSGTGVYLEFPGWRITRRYYSGGSGAWGLDGAGKGDLPGWPNAYYFMNSGDADLVSDTYTLNMSSGSVVTVGFDLIASALYTNAAPSCSGEVDFGGGQVFSWTAEEGSISAANETTTFTTNFTLYKAAASATLTMRFSSGRGENGVPTRSANQTLLDNVSLVVIGEEPPPLGNLIIDGDFNNGNYQNNDPFSSSVGVIVTNLPGRRMLQNSSLGVELMWPGWRATRTYYSGGNNAWGMDASTKPGDMEGWPNVYYFMNSGDATIESDYYPVALYKGDTINISFELIADAVYPTNANGVAASCAGTIDLGDGQTYSWTAEEASVVTNDQTLFFSKEFILTNDASFAALELKFSTGRGYGGSATHSGNQCRLDNVSLISTSAPEKPQILAFSRISSNVYELTVSTKLPQLQHPVSKTSLTALTWSQIPHADNGAGPFIQTNLTHAVVNGVERTIYLEGNAATEFFGIGED